jgi:hypothetical protein
MSAGHRADPLWTDLEHQMRTSIARDDLSSALV